MVVNEVIPEFVPGAKIKVIWVWGCGNKALNRIRDRKKDNVCIDSILEFSNVNLFLNILSEFGIDL